ncbi:MULTISPECIES: epoxide hydrolase N-terminal domain-containing protein [Sorangium]|uniref:epoxide hydrolase N-terminal domain-containing protein n=1 Tax=Sorangium TaxID=39643 RepID=UPI003D9C4D01
MERGDHDPPGLAVDRSQGRYTPRRGAITWKETPAADGYLHEIRAEESGWSATLPYGKAWEFPLRRGSRHPAQHDEGKLPDGQTVHFVHLRSPEPDAQPLLLLHGWPAGGPAGLDRREAQGMV